VKAEAAFQRDPTDKNQRRMRDAHMLVLREREREQKHGHCVDQLGSD